MVDSTKAFVESVRTILDYCNDLVTCERQQAEAVRAQADEEAKSWVRPTDPRWQYALPTPISRAITNGQEVEKKLQAEVNKAAKAIFAAESQFSLATLQALADGPVTAVEVCQLRAAGDAVLRFAGASLRGYGFHADKYTDLGRLQNMANSIPSSSSNVIAAFDQRVGLKPMFDQRR